MIIDRTYPLQFALAEEESMASAKTERYCAILFLTVTEIVVQFVMKQKLFEGRFLIIFLLS